MTATNAATKIKRTTSVVPRIKPNVNLNFIKNLVIKSYYHSLKFLKNFG